jgi:hypothetical protein
MMCADGFLPVVIEDEPPLFASGVGRSGSIRVEYFTCCPPFDPVRLSNTTAATRHCSDPISDFEVDIEDSNETICVDQGARKYSRRMEINRRAWLLETDFSLCCDSLLVDDDDDVDFLDFAECVPYHNEWYEAFQEPSIFGVIQEIKCDLPNGDFPIPRPVGDATIDDIASTGRYQCCKSGTPLPPFVQDSSFQYTGYPQLVLLCIAAILSLITIIGLLVPLVIQLNTGSYEGISTSQHSIDRPSRWSNLVSSSPSTRGSTSLRQPSYSTYYVYLIYLSILDLVFSVSLISKTESVISPDPLRHGARRYELPSGAFSMWLGLIPQGYFFGNMWINAIICYQVLAMLQTSHSAGRINQPSLLRAILGAGSVCVMVILVEVGFYFLADGMEQAQENGDFDKLWAGFVAFMALGFVCSMPPMLYILYVAFLIWWRGFIPATNGTTAIARAMRELAFFFFRIVSVFIALWFPVHVLTQNTWIQTAPPKWVGVMIGYFVIIQPILKFCMVLTKPDANKYIKDLVTMSYCRPKSKKDADTDSNRNGVELSPSNFALSSPSSAPPSLSPSPLRSRSRSSSKSKQNTSSDEDDDFDDDESKEEVEFERAAEPSPPSRLPSRRNRELPITVLRTGETTFKRYFGSAGGNVQQNMGGMDFTSM